MTTDNEWDSVDLEWNPIELVHRLAFEPSVETWVDWIGKVYADTPLDEMFGPDEPMYIQLGIPSPGFIEGVRAELCRRGWNSAIKVR